MKCFRMSDQFIVSTSEGFSVFFKTEKVLARGFSLLALGKIF